MSLLKKIWKFIWEEDSIWSWIVNVILAFIIIKFLLYPGLGWALGTPAPIVAVVSGSMEHEGNFEQFWDDEQCCNSQCSKTLAQGSFYDEKSISYDQFRQFSFVNGFNKGDIMILYSPEKAKVGDVIVYLTTTRPDPIIHRVIAESKVSFTTKGDHNCDVGDFEKNIPKDRVIGKAVWRIPLLGWVKIIAVELLNVVR